MIQPRPVSDAIRRRMSSAKKRGLNPKARHVTILAPDGRLGGLNSIRDCAVFFGIASRTMEARIRRSYNQPAHKQTGWLIPGKESHGPYRAWFTDTGDPKGEHTPLPPNSPDNHNTSGE